MTQADGQPGTSAEPPVEEEPKQKRNRTHWLYILVIGVVGGIIVGLVTPETGSSLGLLARYSST